MKPKKSQPQPKLTAEAPAGWLRTDWLFAFLLAVVTILAYQPVWHAGFIWDDDGFIQNSLAMKDANGLYRFWFTASTPDYFPMTFSSLWLEYRLWGQNAAGYHWTNLLLHTASALVLWRVLARLKIPGARLAAALFALHPVNVESVAWITERKNTLCMLFFVWTLWAYVKFEDSGRRRWYALAVGAFVLTLLSKTAPVALPVILLAAAWWRRDRIEWRDVWRSSVFFAASLALGLVTIWFQYHRVIRGEAIRPDDAGARIAGAGWAIWFYLYKALVPLNLMFCYPRWRVDGASLLSYVPAALFLVALGVSWYFRRRWGKGVLFGLLYFALMLAPILGFLDNFFMRYSLVADHWQYFAILAPITLVAAGLTRVGKSLGQTAPVAAAVLLLAWGTLTWRQARMYHDLETLWRTTIAANPNCFLAQLNLGGMLLERGDLDEAIGHLEKARTVDPESIEVACGLGNAYLSKGQPAQARTYYQKALEIAPNFWEGNYGFGTVLLQQGQTEQAIPYYIKALAGQPYDLMTRNNLGFALMSLGRTDEAIAVLEPALERNPDDVRVHNNLGNALFQKGRIDEGITHFQKALAIDVGFAPAVRDLAFAAWLLATSPDAGIRNGPKAVELASQVNRLSGGRNAQYLATLAAALAEAGRFPEAITTAQQAQSLATAEANAPLMEALQEQIELYQAGRPVRDAKLSRAQQPAGGATPQP